MKHFAYIIGVIVIAVALSVPVVSSAETAVRTGDSVSVTADQTVNGDFYGLAETISISGAVEGDAHMVGGKLTVNGSIAEDMFAISGVTEVHATVTEDVRVIGGDVTIAEHVGGDVFVIGGSLKLLSTATVDGNVYFYGGDAELNGTISGSVFGAAERMRIDGPVGGDVDVQVALPLVLGDRANIEGNVQYTSGSEIVRAQNAVVVGDIQKESLSTDRDTGGMFVSGIVYAFTALILYAIFRTRIIRIVRTGADAFVKDGLIGIIALFMLPIAIVFLMLTMIGAFLGVLALFLYIVLLLVATVLVSAFIGLMLERAIVKTSELGLLWMGIGIVVTVLMLAIPFVGPVVFMIGTATMFGAMIHRLYTHLF